MIQLNQSATNKFIVYSNTITNVNQTFGDYYLIGFLSGFTKIWTFVVPTIITRNKRFIEFEITLNLLSEDQLNAIVTLEPAGNFDYKIWNTDTATLDPSTGDLIDRGQATLFDANNYNQENFAKAKNFTSSNDTLSTILYQAASDSLKNSISYISNNEVSEASAYQAITDSLKNSVAYLSDNEPLKTVIYYAGSKKRVWNTTHIRWNVANIKWDKA